MAYEWTQQDKEEWARLNNMDEMERSSRDEMSLRGLHAKREMIAVQKEKAIEKAGPLHKVSTLLAICAIVSCVGGFAGGGLTPIGVGIGLLLVSGVLGGINKWLMGVK